MAREPQNKTTEQLAAEAVKSGKVKVNVIGSYDKSYIGSTELQNTITIGRRGAIFGAYLKLLPILIFLVTFSHISDLSILANFICTGLGMLVKPPRINNL